MKGQPEKFSLEPCSKVTATDGRGAKVKRQRVPDNWSCDEKAPPTEPIVVLVRGMNRSPHSAERRPGRPELSATVQTMLRSRHARCLGHNVSAAIFGLYPLRHWQPMEDVAKNRCDVLIFTKTDNDSGAVDSTICSRRMTTADIP